MNRVNSIKLALTIAALMMTFGYFTFYHVDYQLLEEHLSQQKWNEADLVTADVLQRISGRKIFGDIDHQSLENISCSDIIRIDKLWRKYSQNRFGFKLQAQKWKVAHNKYPKDFYQQSDFFASQIGWTRDDGYMKQDIDLDFSLNAPFGELPSVNWMVKSTPLGWGWNDTAHIFFLRFTACDK